MPVSADFIIKFSEWAKHDTNVAPKCFSCHIQACKPSYLPYIFTTLSQDEQGDYRLELYNNNN